MKHIKLELQWPRLGCLRTSLVGIGNDVHGIWNTTTLLEISPELIKALLFSLRTSSVSLLRWNFCFEFPLGKIHLHLRYMKKPPGNFFTYPSEAVRLSLRTPQMSCLRKNLYISFWISFSAKWSMAYLGGGGGGGTVETSTVWSNAGYICQVNF